jgi:hypothetical protein
MVVQQGFGLHLYYNCQNPKQLKAKLLGGMSSGKKNPTTTPH